MKQEKEEIERRKEEDITGREEWRKVGAAPPLIASCSIEEPEIRNTYMQTDDDYFQICVHSGKFSSLFDNCGIDTKFTLKQIRPQPARLLDCPLSLRTDIEHLNPPHIP